MKRRFTRILAAFALLVFMTPSFVAWGQTSTTQTLTSSNIKNNATQGDPVDGSYYNWTIVDDNSHIWTAVAIKNQHSNATSDYHFLQIKKYASNKAYYIQVPELGTQITSITMTVSSTQKPMDGGGNSATLFFSSSNSTSSTGEGVASGEGASSVTIDCSSLNMNTGYITASAGVRIWDVSVTYMANNYTITAQSNNTEYGTVSLTGTTITATPATGYRVSTATPYEVISGTATVTQNGNVFSVNPTSNCTVQINFEAIPTHTASFSVNGTVTSTQSVAEGASITFPADPADIEGKTFMGWIFTTINGTTNTAPDFVTSATMGSTDVTFYAVFATATAGEPEETKTQTLQYDTWTYGGSTTDKSSYRLFHEGGYVESAAFDLSKLSKVIVYGGTFGGNSYNSLTIGDGTNVWKNVTVSGSSQTGANTYTGGTALSGNGKLRVISNSGSNSGTGTGVRMSKVEIFTFESTTVYSDYCTTVASPTDPAITLSSYTIDASADGIEDATLNISYSNLTITEYDDFGIQFYDEDENELNGENEPDWLMVLTASDIVDGETVYLVSYTVDPNYGDARTAYFKVFALDDESYVYSNMVIVNQDAYVAPFEPATYKLATSIESGKTYIIVGFDENDAPYAMGEQRSKNRGGYAISVNGDGTIATVNSESVHEVVINALGNNIFTIEDDGYLYAASSTENQLKTESELDDNGKWSIDITNGEATITAQGDKTRKEMHFNPNTNNNNPLFACYTPGNNTGSLPSLYVKVPTLNINGYDNSTNGGYYLIASPVTVDPSTIEGMILTGEDEVNYDLYSFDQTGGGTEGDGKEWRNYKQGAFSLVPGKGYLYANKNDVTLSLIGDDLYSDNGTLTLSYTDDENADFPGLNLVGNPFTYEVTYAITDVETGDLTGTFLKMNAAGNGYEVVDGPITVGPMEGFFAQAQYNDQELTVQEGSKATSHLNLQVSRNNDVDNAIVSFSKGSMMRKFYLSDNTTRVYIPQGNKEYAIVRSAAEGEMPVSFRASENGTYTLAVEAENVEMNYLHLIDNLTGMDVDLLQTPSYTFEAKTSDYASRFRLVFKANGTNENNAETFAYFNGTNWTVSNVGEATLQVVDVTGRTVANQLINGNAELNLNQPAGVYVIRLVNGDNVKTQKVVVR